MAKKITPEIVSKMVSLYNQIGTYSGVAKELGISASTVSRYIKEAQSIKTYNDSIQPTPIEDIEFTNVITFSLLTDEEKDSYTNWLKEFNR